MDELDQKRKEYREDVQSIAAEIAAEVKSGDLARDDVYDRLHETIDGNQWVIYTYRAKLVCAFLSDNEDAAADEGMEIDHSEGIDWSAMAFFAMLADVNAALPDFDEEDDESEEA